MTDEEIHKQMKELLGQPYGVLADWSLVDPAQRKIRRRTDVNGRYV
jgi:hypothetical protein